MGRLEPEPASSLGTSSTITALVQGYTRAGKTTTIIKSCVSAFGPGYVMNCGLRQSMEKAQQIVGNKFKFNMIGADEHCDEDMEDCIVNARKGAKTGDYKWILLDDFNMYVDTLTDREISKDSQKDFNRWPALTNKVLNTVRRLFECHVHTIITTHLLDWKSTPIERQNKKDGRGYVNAFPGQLRVKVPAIIPQVIVLQKNEDGTREFVLNEDGVYGVGCYTLGDIQRIPADCGRLQRELERAGRSDADRKTTKPDDAKPASAGATKPTTGLSARDTSHTSRGDTKPAASATTASTSARKDTSDAARANGARR